MLQDLSASVLFPSCLQHRSFGQWWILFFIFFSSSWLCSVLFFCACACSSTRLLFVAWLCRICISLRSKTCFWLFACELEVNISASGQNVFFFRVHGRSFMIWSRQCKSRNPDRVWSCTWLLWKSDFNHFWYLFIKETKLQVFSLQMGQNTDVEIKNFICFVTSAAINCTFPFSTPCGYMHVNL